MLAASFEQTLALRSDLLSGFDQTLAQGFLPPSRLNAISVKRVGPGVTGVAYGFRLPPKAALRDSPDG